MTKIAHDYVWAGYGIPPMTGPKSAQWIEMSALIAAELDRQFLDGKLGYPNCVEDSTQVVVRDIHDDDGRHIEVSGRLNISALVDAILEQRS